LKKKQRKKKSQSKKKKQITKNIGLKKGIKKIKQTYARNIVIIQKKKFN
jgi:hypothetical protein